MRSGASIIINAVLPSVVLTLSCISVDWAAHLGGLVAGVLVGIPIFALHIESIVWRVLWVVMGSGATLMCFVWSLMHMYSGAIEPAEELRDVCGYYKVRIVLLFLDVNKRLVC